VLTLAAMVSESNKRMDAVNRITSNASAIASNATRALFDAQPALIPQLLLLPDLR